jgi:recombination protein RecT
MNTIEKYIQQPAQYETIKKTLGNNADSFIASMVNISQASNLSECTPESIYNCALKAALLDLPIDLGLAYIIPYKNDKTGITTATFQISAKGLLQLALRTGEYTALKIMTIHKNHNHKWNSWLETLEGDFGKEGNGDVVGYAGMFMLKSGLQKTVFMTKEAVEMHAKKYSKNYNNKNSLWNTDFDKMALKTVLKALLKHGILSIKNQNSDFIKVLKSEDEELDTLQPDTTTQPAALAQAETEDQKNERLHESRLELINRCDTSEKYSKLVEYMEKNGVTEKYQTEMQELLNKLIDIEQQKEQENGTDN